ncbi:MAG TPA: hypothetical protein VIY29_15045, partial [Ktedonobacteraceae bacterium]
GMRDDTEMNVSISHPAMAQRLRMLLMAEHLGLYDDDTLFRLLDSMENVCFPNQRKKTAPFARFLKRWLRPRLSPSGMSPATMGTSLSSEKITGELGDLWANLELQLGDPFSGIALFAKQAKQNFLAVKARQPLVGHLLPYIPHDRAQDYEVEVNAVNGWLDTLPDPQPQDAATS